MMHARALVRLLLGRRDLLRNAFDTGLDIRQRSHWNPQSGDDVQARRMDAADVIGASSEGDVNNSVVQAQLAVEVDISGLQQGVLDNLKLGVAYPQQSSALLGHSYPLNDLNQHLARQLRPKSRTAK